MTIEDLGAVIDLYFEHHAVNNSYTSPLLWAEELALIFREELNEAITMLVVERGVIDV